MSFPFDADAVLEPHRDVKGCACNACRETERDAIRGAERDGVPDSRDEAQGALPLTSEEQR